MKEMWAELESPSADMAKSKGEKKKSIQDVCSEMKSIVEESGYEMGDVLKSLKMDSAQPDDSMDMKEADEAYSPEGGDEPEMGGDEGDSDSSSKKAMLIAMLKKKNQGDMG